MDDMRQESPLGNLITSADAAELLGITRRTFKLLTARGDITPTVVVGRAYLFDRGAVLALLAARDADGLQTPTRPVGRRGRRKAVTA